MKEIFFEIEFRFFFVTREIGNFRYVIQSFLAVNFNSWNTVFYFKINSKHPYKVLSDLAKKRERYVSAMLNLSPLYELLLLSSYTFDVFFSFVLLLFLFYFIFFFHNLQIFHIRIHKCHNLYR